MRYDADVATATPSDRRCTSRSLAGSTQNESHVTISTAVSGSAFGFGGWLIHRSNKSGSVFSVIAAAFGLMVIAAALLYATVTTLVLWKDPRSLRRVLLVHGTPFAVLGAIWAAVFVAGHC